jgi:purine-cytosine permease-like protein
MMGSKVPGRREWVVTYFVTFLFLVGYVLTSVVVAVLLEHFSATKRIENRRRLENKADAFDAHVFDPIVSSLAMFGNSQELTTRARELFELLDCDDLGQVNPKL